MPNDENEPGEVISVNLYELWKLCSDLWGRYKGTFDMLHQGAACQLLKNYSAPLSQLSQCATGLGVLAHECAVKAEHPEDAAKAHLETQRMIHCLLATAFLLGVEAAGPKGS